ncbi:hypothetical protein ACJX0J_020089, partial [Zea mays]
MNIFCDLFFNPNNIFGIEVLELNSFLNNIILQYINPIMHFKISEHDVIYYSATVIRKCLPFLLYMFMSFVVSILYLYAFPVFVVPFTLATIERAEEIILVLDYEMLEFITLHV